MVFFKKKEVVGLDIGSHSIKLVQLNETGKGMELINFGVMPLQTEAVVGGAIMDANIIVEAIQNLIEVQKVKTKDVVTSVSGTSVIIKKVKLPFMTEEELAESIEWEAEQYIPFDISDVNIDFQILESAELLEEKGSDQMEVLIVAIKREKIDDYTNLILEAGMNPVIVDVDAFAIENSYELNYDIKKEIVALVDIGAAVMNINILRDGITTFTRDIFLGGNLYTENIQKELGTSREDAKALKLGVEMEGISKEKVKHVMEKTTEDIFQEVNRSFEFFRSATEDENIDKIVLSGGCSKIKGIDQFLSQRVNIPVEIINPFKKVQFDEKLFDREYIKEIAPLAAVGVGLAIRRIDD